MYGRLEQNSVAKSDLMSVVLLQIYIYNERYAYKTYTCFSVLSAFIEVFSLKPFQSTRMGEEILGELMFHWMEEEDRLVFYQTDIGLKHQLQM